MIAVTGSTGNLGRLIVEQLLGRVDAGKIVAIARSPEKAADLAAKGIIVRKGDYADYESLVSAFDGVAALMFISNANVANRVSEHTNVVDAAKRARVQRVVYTSFSAVEDDNPLAPGHAATEQLLKESGLAYTILRDNYYMDLYVVEVEIAMKTGIYRSPSGEAGAAFVSRADIARAAAVVLTTVGHEGKTYEMTGPTVVKPADFAALASELSGKTSVYEPISWDQLTEDYRGRGMPEEFVPMSVMLEQLIATNVLAKVSDDIAKITGTPAEGFASFVRKALT